MSARKRAVLLLAIAAGLAGLAACGPDASKSSDPDLAILKTMAVAERSASVPSGSAAESGPGAGAEVRALLDRLAAHGFIVDIGAYRTLPEEVVQRDLAYLARAVDLVGRRSKAIIEWWALDESAKPSAETGANGAEGSATETTAEPGAGPFKPSSLLEVPLGAPYFAVARRQGSERLPITLLPTVADLKAADGSAIDRQLATAARWAAGVYFPARLSEVSYPCAMPAGKSSELADGVAPGWVGKVIGRGDDPAFMKAVSALAGPKRFGSVVTAEVTPSLWAFAITPHAGEPPSERVSGELRGYAVPLLDANGAMRGSSISGTTPVRGSVFENVLLQAPDLLTWGRHSFFKLPRPMTAAGKTTDAERAHPQEMFVALVGIAGGGEGSAMRIPAVQAFSKTTSWRPFAEDLALDSTPMVGDFLGGDIRAVAVSASVEPEELIRVLAAMTAVDPLVVLANREAVAGLRMPEAEPGPR